MLLPQDFVTRWQDSQLREQQASQSHFNELCQLVGHKTPTQLDPQGEFFTFEEQVTKATGGKGRADVWYKGHFAWEYKGKHKDLETAYAQLLAYKGDLGNPPLLVVCDFLEYRIYPQWINTSGLPFKFTNQDLLNADTRRFITWLLEHPEKFLELRQTELEKREQITLALANQFARLADMMRENRDEHGQLRWRPMQIARFLTKLVFALFAEDIGILPVLGNVPVIRYIIEHSQNAPTAFVEQMELLFKAMDGARKDYMMQPVPYFNGGLFAESSSGANDQYEVLDLAYIHELGAFDVLLNASRADWRFVNPTIFGTLFEGALDMSKRAQLGAHYTSESDIRLVLEPVLMQPCYDQWNTIRQQAEPLLQTYLANATPKARQTAQDHLLARYNQMMTVLETTTVLDPACGSGNFLYVSLRLLKDLEAKVRYFFEPLGLPFRDVVSPRQLYGIEKDEFAANLAKVVVWIGYLQWRYEEKGILHWHNPQKVYNFPDALTNPIIKDKLSADEADRIICDDAILRYNPEGNPYEPEWPPVDVIVGNPPFLGGSKLRSELGDHYYGKLTKLYKGRVEGFADLVCYWFEKARTQIEHKKAKRAGLLATNSIRGGANREVLKRIKETGDIFLAHADREWLLEGAAVRISMVGFDDGSQTERTFYQNEKSEPKIVPNITPDLTSSVDITVAKDLKENAFICYRTDEKGGSFDIDAQTAKKMLDAINTSGLKNSDVVRPYLNGLDITRGNRNMWIIDFGVDVSQENAQLYELPYEYVLNHVKPERDKVRNEREQKFWWLHRRPAPDMRSAVTKLTRYIVTPAVAKHRLFVWLDKYVIPDHAVYAFARDDDYFFGVLHSKLHEVWSLRMGTSLEDRPRYTPTTTFETFPFPFIPKQEPLDDLRLQKIATCAQQLHKERQAWLDGADLKELGATADNKAMKARTLTNLYNAMSALNQNLTQQENPNPTPQPTSWGGAKASFPYEVGKGREDRGSNTEGKSGASVPFPVRLRALHRALDEAVCEAYGWDMGILDDEEQILEKLLVLNSERSKG